MSNPTFGVIVPSRGEPARLELLLAALEKQVLERARWELILVLDGGSLPEPLARRLAALGGRVIPLATRAGPGAARNAGAAAARAEWLAFTEDDCTPRPDWLERADAHITDTPGLEVLEGLTVKPGDRPVHRQMLEHALCLPTNLFVRRTVFERAGGYCEQYFEPRRGIYFREDTDLAFTLEELGASVAREPGVIVTHPEEHAGVWDPLRWAQRHVMDALLRARHPRLFRQRLEVHRFGPFVVHRPIVRACEAAVGFSLLALVALAGGWRPWALVAGSIAALALAVVWAKWRFDPRRLPVVLLVPLVMVWAQARGSVRAGVLEHASHREHKDPDIQHE